MTGRNVEIKARASDFERQLSKAAELSDGRPERLLQQDTFFGCREGRLKLRRFSESEGELIFYERPDDTGPSESRYMRSPTGDPASLKELLSRSLGIVGTVVKTRTVFLAGRSRLHFDEVEGLGRFIEIEVVLQPGEGLDAGVAVARRLMDGLGISEDDLVDRAYIDLLPRASEPEPNGPEPDAAPGPEGGAMPSIVVRDMDPKTEYYVSACTHVDESAETDAAAAGRLSFLKENYDGGVRAKVALEDGRPLGFLFVMPIELCPWGPLGADLACVPCLFVTPDETGKGAGAALLEAAEEEARQQGMKGMVLQAYYWDFWFMPASYFEKHGYQEAARKGDYGILWKAFDTSAEPPRFLEPSYEFRPIEAKVVVDLFWNEFCLTSGVEAARVRDVASEFGDAVVLNEYKAEDRETFVEHQISRAIYVNGKEIGWGYEAPKEGVREAIQAALDEA
jgi:predicted adenylyl cyclase CyaB